MWRGRSNPPSVTRTSSAPKVQTIAAVLAAPMLQMHLPALRDQLEERLMIERGECWQLHERPRFNVQRSTSN
jgi:hypothetical protein